MYGCTILVFLVTILYISKTESVPVSPTKYDYKEALRLSILFYDAQRSGKLPANNPIPWRGDSAVNDSDGNVDLSGGWYDAGDHVKFNFPMAAATTNLLWGLVKWKDAYQITFQLDAMYDMIRWPLKYYLKCWLPQNDTYYVQVGNPDLDHKFWGRPEDMTMPRPAYKVNKTAPGSDAAGGAAASLAAGYLVFNETDPNFASKLLTAAKSLYLFGKTYQGIYTKSLGPQIGSAYSSSGYKDEMCEGAAWLYKATKDPKYLTDARSFYNPRLAWGLSWNDKSISCQLLLYEITQEHQYLNNVRSFMKSWVPGGTVPYTPCGLAFRDRWGSLRHSANSAFIALMAAADNIGGDDYKTWALTQMNYILGDNNYNISYEIGFGSKYPLHPHHRGSSCQDIPSPCSEASNFHTSDPNPHIIYGGLVGGPGIKDDYTDNREDYVKNEVAVDYNAGFQSALAGLIHFSSRGTLPSPPIPKC